MLGTKKAIKRWDIFHDIIECLTAALEAKDIYTSGHSSRVGDMAYDLAKKFIFDDKELDDIHIAGHLHDIGKIGVPEHILYKKEKLVLDEWVQVKLHPEIGYNILKNSRKLDDIALIVLYHHERWDGRGYPMQLKGSEIPFGARIIAICDTVDAMTSDRPYRRAFTWEQCHEEVIKNKGKQFEPLLVDAIDDLWSVWQKRYSKVSVI